MSKIVQAINSMITNSNKIKEVQRAEKEYFFIYKDKYKWSMRQDNDDVYLWFYPGNETLDDLVSTAEFGWVDSPAMITYKASEIGTQEAWASFRELFNVIKGKIYHIDEVLEDIISDDNADF